MFHKKKLEKDEEALDLEKRLEIAEKKIKVLATASDQLVSHYVTKKTEFNDIKERVMKIEKEIEKEKVGNMFW